LTGPAITVAEQGVMAIIVQGSTAPDEIDDVTQEHAQGASQNLCDKQIYKRHR
jgi:hypothetical protein